MVRRTAWLCEPAATAALACVWIKIALGWLKADEGAEGAVQANLLRCIFGNLFHCGDIDLAILGWNDATIPRIAEGIYAERAFARMPILHDALLDAGCADEALLSHCRNPEGHALGCWVLDRILGKE